MDATDFKKLVLSEFPALREDFEGWEDLLHLQVGDFCRFTQAAIEMRSFEVVSKCFEIANTALMEGDGRKPFATTEALLPVAAELREITLLVSAEPAVADRLLDRAEARCVAHFQGPGQRRDRSHSGDRSQSLEPLDQHRILLERFQQSSVQLDGTIDMLPAHPE